MNKRKPELEMYAALDPRIALLRDLREGQRSMLSARREAQWPTWQMDRSWPDRAAARITAWSAEDNAGVLKWDRVALALCGAGVLALLVVITVALILSRGVG